LELGQSESAAEVPEICMEVEGPVLWSSGVGARSQRNRGTEDVVDVGERNTRKKKKPSWR